MTTYQIHRKEGKYGMPRLESWQYLGDWFAGDFDLFLDNVYSDSERWDPCWQHEIFARTSQIYAEEVLNGINSCIISHHNDAKSGMVNVYGIDLNNYELVKVEETETITRI